MARCAHPRAPVLVQKRRAGRRVDTGVLPAVDDHARNDHGLLCADTMAPLAGFGNYLLPIQIGAGDMPFPRMNVMSFWLTLLSFLVAMSSFFVSQGLPLSGWTAYAPLSALGEVAGPGEGTGQVLWATSVAIFSAAQLLGSLNFISATLDLRCKGMSLMRLPLTVWAWFITACMGLTAFAVLLPTCILLILDHVAGTSFFVPSNLVVNDQLQHHGGGSALLWQHLFWFFGHPEVYIAIVPAFGVVSHVLVTNLRRPLLSYRWVVYSMVAIAVLSSVVWGHHMFVSGMNPFSSVVFSIPTLVITIPSAVIVLIWIGSIYGSRLQINSASLFALALSRCSSAEALRASFWHSPRWTSCCTPPTSWSDTSTWSWRLRHYSASSLQPISGFPRSPAA